MDFFKSSGEVLSKLTNDMNALQSALPGTVARIRDTLSVAS